MKVKCKQCPECGCKEDISSYADSLGIGYRVCSKCEQEWCTDIDYRFTIFCSFLKKVKKNIDNIRKTIKTDFTSY